MSKANQTAQTYQQRVDSIRARHTKNNELWSGEYFFATDPKEFSRKLDSLSKSVSKLIDNADWDNAAKIEWQLLDGCQRDLMREYARIADYFNETYREELNILRIERQSHKTALLYRTLTTLSVGGSIMLIYTLANWLGITLPLMKI